jgi:hypothetical protein
VPPDPLVPVAPVPALVPVLEPGRERDEVSRMAPVSVAARLRDALSLILVPVAPVPLVPEGAVPDIEPVAPIDVSVPIVPAVPAAPVPDVPTSPALVPAVVSRLLPVLQAPTASTAASASTPLFRVALRIDLSPSSRLGDEVRRVAGRRSEGEEGAKGEPRGGVALPY